MNWTHHTGDVYHVTGILQSGKRFRRIQTANPYYALGINLFRGSVWVMRNGKRSLIKRVWN